MTGLGQEWTKTIRALSKISDYYRELNSVISLGTDLKIRREAIEKFLKQPRIVLDLGSGDGVFTEVTIFSKPSIHLVVMLDVLLEMLKKAKKIDNVEKVQGTFEHLPFRDLGFDNIIAAFSLRDSINLEKALSEIKRIMKDHGGLVVVDLGKPDTYLKRFLIFFYWNVIAPLIAMIKLGSRGIFSSLEIARTLKPYPTNSHLAKIYKKYFSHTVLFEKFIGGVILLHASKEFSREAS
ncbi:MAG: class I SAM-dependent methyltransferase [Aigarchaeota archaeon]|nr:class I SAM-dependent methyltransferase [Aigarchaeota archaeon]MCX8193259.1 class I SAM-dependent methyltransferase [Nitrososphaeria archaeon]MDW7986898.1 class I SAM-dependent methyltransferase [Nitrososphaerota archaeon]